ncbi:MAG: tRNA (adenosine(37)-N6)-dimethylallyltransferase MiaA [Ruminococcaceae bacterium]|nr:tRNA (adenosine(37)-N6)-dimethylallyltransferase MiaA [Oscillospiraceae bacterium]
MRQKIVTVAGPTASGKTALAVQIALKIGGEVISCDSMQIYRGMQIGTAAPTAEEMCGIPHHMVAIANPDEPFSCADYTERAEACIREIAARGRVPVICGGTGLYLDSLLRVSAFSESEKTDEVRAALHAFAEKNGAEALHARLAAVDPESAEAIHYNNVRRVVRALEIFETTGVTKSEWDKRSLAVEPKYDAFMTVLDFRDRQRLYDRIDRRVSLMMDAGLLDEVRTLYNAGMLKDNYIAAQAIGYKEFLPYFSGEAAPEECADQVRLSSRRYAKRQLTWFRRYKDALWLYPDEAGESLASAESLAAQAVSAMKETGFL